MNRKVRLVCGMLVVMFLSNTLSLYLGYIAGQEANPSIGRQATND